VTDYTKTTGNETADAVLGCGAFLALAGFFIWLFFIREPHSEWKQTVDQEIQPVQEGERIRIENARLACDSGVQSACVEYAELID
jgi:hypothetical protein